MIDYIILYKLDGQRTAGATPFMGRGKTDVDWAILTAKQLPGPGYYNIDDPEHRRLPPTTTFVSRGKTDLDWKILNASMMPGPGYYDLEMNSNVMPTLTTLVSPKKNKLNLTQ